MRPITDYDEACTVFEEFGVDMLKERLKASDDYCHKILNEAAHHHDKDIVGAVVGFTDSDSVGQALYSALDNTRFGNCDPELVKMFIPHMDCKYAGSPALVKAAKNNDTQNFNLLVPHSEISDRNAYSILSYSIEHKNKEMLNAVIPYLNDPSRVGETVMKAVKVGYAEGVEALLPRANLIALFKSIGSGKPIYNTEVSHQSALDNAEIFKCLEMVNATFKEKMNYDLFKDMPALDFYKTPATSKVKM